MLKPLSDVLEACIAPKILEILICGVAIYFPRLEWNDVQEFVVVDKSTVLAAHRYSSKFLLHLCISLQDNPVSPPSKPKKHIRPLQEVSEEV